MQTTSWSYRMTDIEYLDSLVSAYGHRVFAKYNAKNPSLDVYIGRPSILGKPFMTRNNKTLKDRIDNCVKFKFYLHDIIKTNSNPALINAVRALKGKNVVCWCSNGTTHVSEGARYCHGHILLSTCDYLNGVQ